MKPLSYAELFSKAGFRVAEVASILQIHRVTASRFKHRGFKSCDAKVVTRVHSLCTLSAQAVSRQELPIPKDFVHGKSNRMAAILVILKRQQGL